MTSRTDDMLKLKFMAVVHVVYFREASKSYFVCE
jgi:hypothetical protein